MFDYFTHSLYTVTKWENGKMKVYLSQGFIEKVNLSTYPAMKGRGAVEM